MANIFKAPFGQTSQTRFAEVTGVATPADDTANAVLLATAGSDGALVTRVSAMPRATVTTSGLYLYISNDSGTTKYLVDSELMAAHTVAVDTAIPETYFSNISEDTPIRLKAGDELYAGSGVALADGIVFAAEWTDF